MHVHAVRIETMLTNAQEELRRVRAELERERAVSDLIRNYIIDGIRDKTLKFDLTKPPVCGGTMG